MALLAENHRRPYFAAFFAAALILMAALQWLDAGLKTPASPAGIVSFEFAATPENAHAMMAAWGPQGQIRAGLSLGLDYLFMVCYAAAIALSIVLVAGRFSPDARRWRIAARWLAWGQLAAALFDAVENVGLIRVLLGSADPVWPAVSAVCAGFKFALVGLGLLFVIIGLGVSLRRRGAR